MLSPPTRNDRPGLRDPGRAAMEPSSLITRTCLTATLVTLTLGRRVDASAGTGIVATVARSPAAPPRKLRRCIVLPPDRSLTVRWQCLDPLQQRPGQLLIRRADRHALGEVVGVLELHRFGAAALGSAQAFDQGGGRGLHRRRIELGIAIKERVRTGG